MQAISCMATTPSTHDDTAFGAPSPELDASEADAELPEHISWDADPALILEAKQALAENDGIYYSQPVH